MQIAFQHKSASSFAQSCLSAYGGGQWSTRIKAHPSVLCGGIAPLCEFDDDFPRNAMSHADLDGKTTATVVLRSLRSGVLPYVASIDSDESYFQAICGDEGPLKWTYGQPLLRAAEVAFLGLGLGRTEEALRIAFRAKARLFLTQLEQRNVEDYIDAILLAAWRAAEVPNPTFQRTAMRPLN